MKFTIIRFLKSTFIQLKLHVLFSPLTGAMLQLANMTRLSKWASQHKKISYNDFYSKWNYDKRYDLYRYVLEKENLKAPINYLEFGVASGVSFNWWMIENSEAESAFYGFDTFTGLPEDFGPYKKGYPGCKMELVNRCRFVPQSCFCCKLCFIPFCIQQVFNSKPHFIFWLTVIERSIHRNV